LGVNKIKTQLFKNAQEHAMIAYRKGEKERTQKGTRGGEHAFLSLIVIGIENEQHI